MLSILVCIFCVAFITTCVKIIACFVTFPRGFTIPAVILSVAMICGCLYVTGTTIIGGVDAYQLSHPDHTYDTRMANQEDDLFLMCENWADEKDVKYTAANVDEFVNEHPNVKWRLGWDYVSYSFEKYNHERLASQNITVLSHLYFWPLI